MNKEYITAVHTSAAQLAALSRPEVVAWLEEHHEAEIEIWTNRRSLHTHITATYASADTYENLVLWADYANHETISANEQLSCTELSGPASTSLIVRRHESAPLPKDVVATLRRIGKIQMYYPEAYESLAC